MIDGSSLRVALLAFFLVAPSAVAAGPSPMLGSPSTTDAQPITDVAMEPTGRYALVVVQADVPTVPGIGNINPQQTDPDVYGCDFGDPTRASTARGCPADLAGRHRSDPSSTARLVQVVAATSFVGPGSGTVVRYAVGGPANKVSFWSGTETASRWDVTLPTDMPVLNVSISPNGTRLVAATDASGIGGSAPGSTLYVYDTTGTTGQYKWEFNLSDVTGQRNGVRVRDLDHSRGGRFVAVGTTPASGGTDGALIFLDVHGDSRPIGDDVRKRGVSGTVNDIEFSDDGRALVVGTSNVLYYWPLPDGRPPVSGDYRAWSLGLGGGGVSQVAVTGDGAHFAAASGERLHFFRALANEDVAERVGGPDGVSLGAPISDLAWDRTGRLLVAIAGNMVYGFTSNSTEPLWRFDAREAANGGLDGPLRKVQLSDTAGRILVAGVTRVMSYETRTTATVEHVGVKPIIAATGSTVRVDFRITNTGSLEDAFEFVVRPPLTTVQWPTINPPQTVALRPEQPALVSMNVTVPEGHPPGTFPLTLQAYSTGLRNASRDPLVATVDLEIQIPRSVALAVEPAQEGVSLEKGDEATVVVTVRNTGNADGLVNLTADQRLTRGSPWTIRLNPEQVFIPAGGEEDVSLVIVAPSDGIEGDENAITFIAREGIVEARQDITAFISAEFGAELNATNRSLEFTTRAPQTFTVTLRNTGNTNDRYNITHSIAAPASADWSITLSREQLTVENGRTGSFTVTITPNVAQPRTATLNIMAKSLRALPGAEAEDQLALSLSYREVPRDDDTGSFIPAPPGALVVALIALAAIAARRARGGRP